MASLPPTIDWCGFKERKPDFSIICLSVTFSMTFMKFLQHHYLTNVP